MAESDSTATRGEWFLSSKGRQLYPFAMRPEDIDPEEIAHSLSMLCRFNGHCREFYSVAQHSVLVSRALPLRFAFCGLMHDATEAYCGDMIRPLKRALPAYAAVEDGIWRVIAERYGLPAIIPPEVKLADTRMLQTERRVLLAPHRWRWMEDQIADDAVRPYEFTIEPLAPRAARAEFLARFSALAHDDSALEACFWTPDSGVWRTSCGEVHAFTMHQLCPYCGGAVRVEE